ncbi:hypothetical protein LK09_03870 [Microbacterium mangrovi]|uniref:NAD(P)H-hydrate epimerase n=1 Tax=Microbacterium mangrovi TaxID=1348253 RepID=A0A0B2AC43_9MICO|nr:NAD(P)H-hydrate epimerase [Microbacterium mangrovi]KHK99157.1 hypothetical protein LK09_03870 [Microbacterium mangrovi]
MVTVGAFTAGQIRAAEAPLLAAGVPLMRRAAAALAQVVAEEAPQRMLVLAGAGDNGGDALFAGAELAADGTAVDILRTSARVHEGALDAARAAGASEVELAVAARREYDLVLDGILGIGARGGLRGAARQAVETLIGTPARVVAVDLPSGLDPDDGTTDGVVLPAETTVTFGGVKAGLRRGAGRRLSGRIVLVNLGLALTDPVASVWIDEVRRG